MRGEGPGDAGALDPARFGVALRAARILAQHAARVQQHATARACFRLPGGPNTVIPAPRPFGKLRACFHGDRGQASREGEVCSFLRHSVRLLAEGVAGPARICNAGASFRDTKVALRGRGGQGDGAGSLSRVFTVIGHPQGTPLRMPWGLTPFEGRVSGPRGRFLAWARVARLCVCFKRAGENAGLGRISGEKWRRRG